MADGRLIRVHPDLDYDELELEIERRLMGLDGGSRRRLIEETSEKSSSKPSLVRPMAGRLLATRFMREELARHPRVYRALRQLYQLVSAR